MAGRDSQPTQGTEIAAGDSLGRWLALHHTVGVGAARKRQLLAHFPSIDALFDTRRAELERILGERLPALDQLLAGPDPALETTTRAWLAEARNFLVTWADADYPPLLREISDPPLLLYGVGQRAALSHPTIAVVGSRNPTPGGRANAHAFAEHLARAGLSVASGLALGIDTAAHNGALAANGMTVAVTGTGLDRVYPPRNRALAHRIADHGVLLSEFALGTPPRAENFPIRNRIISGLSLGVLVVEAACKSGSLITARLAGEQGREVFAIPGSIHSPLARGCHALIRQGAKLVETAQDILEELGALAGVVTSTPVVAGADNTPTDAAERRLLDCLGFDPVDIDGLVACSGLTPQAVSSMLLQLELRGMVASLAGGRYQRTT
ncbi:MAG: DNA-processing protein DprA [Pseudomonadota bacterium]|nr:MAG: DNA-processing protein DprA [Pseudomonadota bacterium]